MAGTFMKNRNNNRKNHFTALCLVFACAFILTGCPDNYGPGKKLSVEDRNERLEEEKENQKEKEKKDGQADEKEDEKEEAAVPEAETETVYADWSEYFNGLNGTAVIYDASDSRYTIYNNDLALTRSSPCSTFKIISSLIALENGIIIPENSTRTWNGEIFWNEDWNKDIDFQEAFLTSCVWYFRQVIDDIGKDLMQRELDKLQYGNCDISDWEGKLNTNNSNRALTGFWIESSLMVSPKEQAEVMERIFGSSSDYSEETRNELKKVMLVPEQDSTDITIYGKTGMGKADGMNVSSTLAKEIAIELISDYCAS